MYVVDQRELDVLEGILKMRNSQLMISLNTQYLNLVPHKS